MGLRTAVSQSWVLTTMATAFALWAGYHAVQAFALSENIWAFDGSYVGTNAVGGLVGVAVLVAFVALLFVLLGELGESDPSPEAWPPEE
ncbi:hypothetical protein Hbl1158_13655 [Halobaculum sp. CBA1158]|uniref:hypothetical protein n=1 Tax=Halobaculum sp. CBA1158 TaxID=2904243 RepID=UPI001F42F229|nr:hypothetical protein [Halobaculum sp. CBA1158]UIO99554.1 hypothetical protein Hbl1158_13655 [Halobaculum sp. CBA1158]